MDIMGIAQMNMAMSTQQVQQAASVKVLQASSTSLMKESAAIAENAMSALFEGMEEALTGLGLGESIDIMV